MSKYIVAIPFYKNEEFIEKIISWYDSIDSHKDRLLISKLIIYNDCPSSDKSSYLEKVCLEKSFIYICNEKNIGYLNTVNLAYDLAKKDDSNLILLNSDTIPFPGFLAEIDKCFFMDSMLGIVSARSNNATICNMYNEVDYFSGDDSIEKYNRDIKILSKYLPLISYAPVVTGFCFAINIKVIKNFDGFDKVFSVGYEEENEYCLRVSERGFRIGISNKAFVVHLEGKSFGLTENREKIKNENYRIIRNNYPYYDSLIENYANSMDRKVQIMVSRAISNNIKYLIDARVLSACHNGSNKFIYEFLKAFSNLGLRADVVGDLDALNFHSINKFSTLNFIKNPEMIYEYGFALGQPMQNSNLWLVPLNSLVSTCIFFDTIAHDCPQLRSENLLLDSIWSLMPYIYTDISFISNHSKRQFDLKFGGGVANLHSHLLPINIEDKKVDNNNINKTALVFGNKFLHKGQDILLKSFCQKDIKYYVLGPIIENSGPNIIFLPPGETDDSELDQIMRSVDYILMPSFAEGFGFPLLEALSYGKPIYCRDIDCYREIISSLPEEKAKLIRLVSSFDVPFSFSHNLDGRNFVKSYANYDKYISEILLDIDKKSSIQIYSLLKSRLQMIECSFKEPIFYETIGLAKKIYRVLLKTRFNKYIRKLKEFMFGFPSIKRFMGQK
jgi:GT2 family glycosyltransferase